jgi:hypothetical protein
VNHNLVYFYYNLGNDFRIAVVYLPTHELLWNNNLSETDLVTAINIIEFRKDALVHLRNEINNFNELAKICIQAKNQIQYIESENIDFSKIPIIPQS